MATRVFTSMVMGVADFNVNAGLAWVSTDEDVCGGLSNVTSFYIPGKITVVNIGDIYNVSCRLESIAEVMRLHGSVGTLLVQESFWTGTSAVWSDQASRNALTGYPILFANSYLLLDFLSLTPEDLEVLNTFAWNATMAGGGSSWRNVSVTYGYVFQVTFVMFSLLNCFLATKSLVTTFIQDRKANKQSVLTLSTCCVGLELIANAVRLGYFAVDPLLMWGTAPLELFVFLNLGFVSFTLATSMLTAIFWIRVIKGKSSR